MKVVSSIEQNKTEDNKCCFLHFGRGVQDPLSGDQGGGGSLDPWTPPGSAPAYTYTPKVILIVSRNARLIIRYNILIYININMQYYFKVCVFLSSKGTGYRMMSVHTVEKHVEN